MAKQSISNALCVQNARAEFWVSIGGPGMNQVVKSVRSWKLPSKTNRSDESKLCAVDSRISASGCRACVGLCRCFKNQTAKHLEDSSLPCFHRVRVTEVFQVLMPMSKTPPSKCLLNCLMFSCRPKLPWMVQRALHTFFCN